MRRVVIAALIALWCVPVSAAAGDVTRRDGFLALWSGISRIIWETNEKPFLDVGQDDQGFAEITFAKARGILDDEQHFRPDDVLLLSDAVLWLLRTRNVDDLENLVPEKIPEFLKKYPFVDPASPLNVPVGPSEKLLALAGSFDEMLVKEVHEVSLYSEKFHGKGTAFGELFDMYALTAAHRTFPANTLVKVTNVENEKSVIVRINDRGPYVDGRDMDLSLAAFTLIAPRSQGVARATFQRLGDASLVGACGSAPRQYQRRIAQNVHLNRGLPHTVAIGETVTLSSTRSFVVRAISYPDGTSERVQDWVLAGEVFTFVPSQAGEYVFQLGTINGRSRALRMEAWQCS